MKTNQTYLKTLSDNLNKLPYQDKQDALAYYTEFINDGNFKSYDEIVTKLGTPAQLAHKITADYAIQTDNAKQKHTSHGIKHNVLLIIGILLSISSPLWIVPVGICLILVAVLVLVAAVLIIVGIFTGIMLCISGVMTLFSQGIISLAVLGLGLLILGIIIAIPGICYFVIRFIIQVLTNTIKWIYGKYQTHENKQEV